MKSIQIQALQFFELLKLHDTSMWEIFANMIDGEEKDVVFVDEKEEILFNYVLPKTLEELTSDQEKFAKEFSEKLKNLN